MSSHDTGGGGNGSPGTGNGGNGSPQTGGGGNGSPSDETIPSWAQNMVEVTLISRESVEAAINIQGLLMVLTRDDNQLVQAAIRLGVPITDPTETYASGKSPWLTTNLPTVASVFWAQYHPLSIAHGPPADSDHISNYPPILTWIQTNDSHLVTITEINGQQRTQVTFMDPNMEAFNSSNMESVGNLWFLTRLQWLDDDHGFYPSSEYSNTIYGNSAADQFQSNWSYSNPSYQAAELSVLADLGGLPSTFAFGGHETSTTITVPTPDAFKDIINAQVDTIISQVVISDVGNQIVNPTVDYGRLKEK